MNWFLNLPLETRLLLVTAVGVLAGTQVNRGIYRLAWNSRAIGPWSAADPKAPPRSWFDYVPVLGWLSISREASIHGAGFWVRPMLIEISLGAGLAALYQWETGLGLLPPDFEPAQNQTSALVVMAHAQFLSHSLLICLMTVATFIDFDEKTIPDAITLPGTLIAILLAGVLPLTALPILVARPPAPLNAENLLLVSPPLQAFGQQNPFPPPIWPNWLDAWHGLLIGVACYVGWIAAIVPKTVWLRGGFAKAVRFLLASMWRRAANWFWATIITCGIGLIVFIWWQGGAGWQGLLTALVGMAFGGGLVWAVRIIGTWVLQKEAMGFGDVTLMAMVGAFLGWQASLIVFFLAPFAGVIVALARFVMTRRRDIAYGPFLCVAAGFLIVQWASVWENWGRDVFGLGWMVPTFLLVCLVLMGVMLAGYRAITGGR